MEVLFAVIEIRKESSSFTIAFMRMIPLFMYSVILDYYSIIKFLEKLHSNLTWVQKAINLFNKQK